MPSSATAGILHPLSFNQVRSLNLPNVASATAKTSLGYLGSCCFSSRRSRQGASGVTDDQSVTFIPCAFLWPRFPYSWVGSVLWRECRVCTYLSFSFAFLVSVGGSFTPSVLGLLEELFHLDIGSSALQQIIGASNTQVLLIELQFSSQNLHAVALRVRYNVASVA